MYCRPVWTVLFQLMVVQPALPSAPAVLVDPGAARRNALADADRAPLRAAETLVLVGDAQTALEVLRRAKEGGRAPHVEPRAIRIQIEALTTLRDERALRAAATRLGAHEAWQARADRARDDAERLRWHRLIERLGLSLFAFALAILGINGARALIAVRWPTVWMAVVSVGATTLVESTAPRLGSVVALVGGGLLVLTHAAAATVDRVRPDARGRLLACALVLTGAAGLVVGVGARLSAPGLFALLASG